MTPTKRVRFWAPEYTAHVEASRRDTTGVTRWCPKCLTRVRKYSLSGKPRRHACDHPPRAPKQRTCPTCGKPVRTTVRRHGCDDVAPIEVPPDTPERRCIWCREEWPEHRAYFERSGGRWRATCRACRADRRKALKRGAKHRKPGPKPSGWHPDARKRRRPNLLKTDGAYRQCPACASVVWVRVFSGGVYPRLPVHKDREGCRCVMSGKRWC